MQETLVVDNQDHNKDPILDYEKPMMVNRLGAAALDLAIYILLSLIIITIAGVFLNRGSALSDAKLLINEHIKSSHLSKYEEKHGYVTYNDDDLLSLSDDDNAFIINQLAYFYLSYLTGENIQEGFTYSLDKDTPVIDDILPKTYYSVAYFNENVLSLPKESESPINDYFIYQKNGEENDYTKIGVINPNYIIKEQTNNGVIKHIVRETKLLNFLSDVYDKAVKLFYNQSFIKQADNTIYTINTILMFAATMPSFIAFYIIIPLCSPFGKTIGKHLLSIAVVSSHGFIIKKWQVLLRGLPILAATVYICLVSSLYYQLMAPLVILLISLGFLLFDPRRRALHDFMANTSVIKAERGLRVYPDEESYQQAQAIIKERNNQKNG